MPKSIAPQRPPGTAPVSVPASDARVETSAGGTLAKGLAIIPSKIAPAKPGRPVLSRPRLVDWFEQHEDKRLILVSAEAGYGKSTLLEEHSRHTSRRCAWYRLESSDRDLLVFVGHLIASLRQLAPDFGTETDAALVDVLANECDLADVPSRLLADLGNAELGDADLLLDDFHHLHGAAAVGHLLERIARLAPEGLRIVLSGRGVPDLALGRAYAQGRIAQLTIDDLRFTNCEIRALFKALHQQPLDEQAYAVVGERTEGWPASLQLVSASISGSDSKEVSSFIGALNGASGPIYDFLAEEVLTRLSQATDQVLMRASLIDRVKKRYVSAAHAVAAAPSTDAEIEQALVDAEDRGLLSDRNSPAGGRIHPLFRDFLAHRLRHAETEATINAMHRAIAMSASSEKGDWLVAAKHFALAGDDDSSMRVLGLAAVDALGAGEWNSAAQVLAYMPDAPRPASVEAIKARALVSDGKPKDAISLLEGVATNDMDVHEQILVSLARAGAEQVHGNGDEVWQQVDALQAASPEDPVVRQLVDAWALIGQATNGSSISAARFSLEKLVHAASARKLFHFECIALHNAATAALAQADYVGAISMSTKAADAISESPADADVVPSTLMVKAIALCELGDAEAGFALAAQALEMDGAHPDVLADAAYLAAIRGRVGQAKALIHALKRMISKGPTELGTPQRAAIANVATLLSLGRLTQAEADARSLVADAHGDLDGKARSAYLAATAAYLNDSAGVRGDLHEAMRIANAQEAWRWDLRLRLLDACLEADGAAFTWAVDECSETSGLALLELADVICRGIHLVSSVPASVESSIAGHPDRWRPALRRRISSSEQEGADAAARLLAVYGTEDDATALRDFERQRSHGRRTPLSKMLAHRVSPTLRVHDLGRTTYEVSGVESRSSGARRKPMSLLLFLATRPKQTATREQVMEALWPYQSPASATNSLHQTLHFVRREIAPWREDGTGAEYVPLDSEVIYLDPLLVQVDSVSFVRQAADALASADISKSGVSIAKLYVGRFAPEFEYEDWAVDWRAHVHAQYLLLAQATASAMLDAGSPKQSVEVLSRAIEIDELALDLRGTLVRALLAAGAGDAAKEHYRHFVKLVERELDTTAPSLEDLVNGTSEWGGPR